MTRFCFVQNGKPHFGFDRKWVSRINTSMAKQTAEKAKKLLITSRMRKVEPIRQSL